MSESPAPPPSPEPPAESPEQPAAPPPRRDPLPWLIGAGFLVLAVALVWVWRHPSIPEPLASQTKTLPGQLTELEARVSRLEQRPTPPVPDIGSLVSRLATLEQRPAPQASVSAPPPDFGPLAARVAALEQRQPASLTPLETRLAALENADHSAQAELSRRLTADEARLAANEKQAAHTAQVQVVTLALAAGQKLGDLPGAPPGLARFANAPPPTEGTVRATFPPAARAALAAAHPDEQDRPLMTRLWSQAQELVTIRQGDHVLVGDPTAGVLERARAALEAGDLAAAAAEVGTLQGAAGQAMAPWLAQTRALLDARSALAAWAAAG